MDYVAGKTSTYIYVFVRVSVRATTYTFHCNAATIQSTNYTRYNCITSLGSMHVCICIRAGLARHVPKSARHHCVLLNDKKYYAFDERVSSAFRLNPTNENELPSTLAFSHARDVKRMKTRTSTISLPFSIFLFFFCSCFLSFLCPFRFDCYFLFLSFVAFLL